MKRRSHGLHLTDDERAALYADIMAGDGNRVLAHRYNLSERVVQKYRSQHGAWGKRKGGPRGTKAQPNYAARQLCLVAGCFETAAPKFCPAHKFTPPANLARLTARR
ncbi:MAG: hypothetical protein JO256_09195 [Alphaproteobacteria bacterium]|nr:hypothetical protein [Alphaproteobacteria bacterium]